MYNPRFAVSRFANESKFGCEPCGVGTSAVEVPEEGVEVPDRETGVPQIGRLFERIPVCVRESVGVMAWGVSAVSYKELGLGYNYEDSGHTFDSSSESL